MFLALEKKGVLGRPQEALLGCEINDGDQDVGAYDIFFLDFISP
jgi:hypothetical protein